MSDQTNPFKYLGSAVKYRNPLLACVLGDYFLNWCKVGAKAPLETLQLLH